MTAEASVPEQPEPPARLPHHERFDEIAAQVLARQQRDREQRQTQKPA